jgi:broad specificity phosphatase PhoE
MKLILIRHGESTANYSNSKEPNPPLTVTGIEQARYTSQFLAQEQLGEIMTSKLERARSTAEEIRRGQVGAIVSEIADLKML